MTILIIKYNGNNDNHYFENNTDIPPMEAL